MDSSESKKLSEDSKDVSSRLELLMFSLGTKETFGVNVLKIREVCSCPSLDSIPNAKKGLSGMFSLRGSIMSALDLAAFADIGEGGENSRSTLMVGEFDGMEVGFLVHSVDKIVRVEWDRVRAPKGMMEGGANGLLTALVEVDGKLVSILDMEKVLDMAFGDRPGRGLGEVSSVDKVKTGFALVVDDSALARKKIGEVLDRMGAQWISAENGKEAWERLDKMMQNPSSNDLRLILTDAEMPEMDGYALTRKVKGDVRFDGLPVVVHSSISMRLNQDNVDKSGADAFVEKFDPECLADAVAKNWRAR